MKPQMNTDQSTTKTRRREKMTGYWMGRICWDKDYRIKQHRITEDYGINMD